jgi:predicted nucleic acid-binding Zn ribbon protein
LAHGAEPGRSRRETLLLELGALVYELHRHGRRAPELLQKKAAELDAVDDSGGEPAQIEIVPCPACGEPAESDQLVCLNCGEPLGLNGKQQQKSSLGALVALIAVVVVGAAAAGFALNELTSGSGDEGEAQRTTQPAPEPEPEPEPAPTAEPEPAPEAEGAPQPAKQSLLLKWPRNLTAHTVVLVNTSDRAAARQVARAAARSGIEAGLLRSEEYDLGTGLWIVFAGRFDTRRGAESQARDLGARYPGAYVLLVEPRSQ